MMRVCLRIYAAVVLLIAGWAWVIEAAMHHGTKEHLFPAVVLMIVTMPLSLVVGPLLAAAPFLADGPFVPLIALTLIGFVQVGCLVAAEYFVSRRKGLRPR